MTWESYAYIGIFLAWAAVETAGLIQKDRPSAPRTLSANIRWLIQGAGPWHVHARWALLVFFAWIKPHLLGP